MRKGISAGCGLFSCVLALSLVWGCSPVDGRGGATGDHGALVFATELVRFEPGTGSGFGQDELPEIVLGAPGEASESAGSLHVLSLGVGGYVELGFGDKRIVDGPGADFIVFENAFWPGGDREKVWAEPGEVSVSADGVHWFAFPCEPHGTMDRTYPGCAGWSPTRAFDPFSLGELAPDIVGGDAFDLAAVGLEEARFVRILDLSAEGAPPSAGFDLDAVGIVHWQISATDP